MGMNNRNTIINVLNKIASDKRMLNHADYWALICGEAAELLKEDERAIKFQSDRLDELLKAQEQKKPNCKAANYDAGGCLGYGYGDNDDEPIEVCKCCAKYTGNNEME